MRYRERRVRDIGPPPGVRERRATQRAIVEGPNEPNAMASAEAVAPGLHSARVEPEHTKRVERIVVPPRRRGGWRRDILIAASTLSALIILLILAVFALTGTDWGRERVRRFAEARLNSVAHGRVRIGKLTGNLLVGMTVHDFSITDSTGAPFVAVQSFSGDYSVWSFWRKHIWIQNAVIVRPLIVLDKPPDGQWNWQRIFPRDTTPKPPSRQVGWGDWIRFTNSRVVGGQLVVRTAWHPAENLKTRAARDSAIRDVLSGRSRLMVQSVKGGFQKVIQLDSVTATIPFLRLSEPGYANRLAQISALTMVAYPFRPPGAIVRDLKGSFPFNNDSVWWKGAYAAMPRSRLSGNGSYQFNSGDMWLTLHGTPATFSDLRWVYPRLPANGRGTGDMKISWKGAVQDYYADNADVSIGAARVRGHFGIRLSDTLTIHDSDIRFANVDTRLIEQLVPHFTSPRRGTLSGRAKADGGRHALVVDADVTFADQRAGTSRVAAVGEVGFLAHGIRARNLRLRLKPLQVELARSYDPTLPISGIVTGTALLNGSTDTQLAIQADVAHHDRGILSAANGKATIRLASAREKYFDIAVNAHPLSLLEVGRFFPSVGLRGDVSGPVHVVGTPSQLRVNADLRLPKGGTLATRGTLAFAGKRSAYDLTATLASVDLNAVLSKSPTTHFTGRAIVRGRGVQLATMDATIAADLAASRWDTLTVDRAIIRARLSNGLAQLTQLDVRAGPAYATATGDFGLTHSRTGTLTFHVSTDSLGAFARFLPKSAADTGMVAPRPRVLARALERARADSARIDRATEVERMISGAPAPRLVVSAPRVVPRGTLSGSLQAAGTLRGNIYDFDLRGRAAGRNLTARGNFVHAFQSEFAWTNARTPRSNLVLALDGDSLAVGGFWFDTAAVRLSYQKPNGHVEVAIRQGGDRDYGLRGDFALNPTRNQLRIANMTLRFDTAYWAAPHPSLIQWGGPGIQVTDFELRNRGNGRVYANGLLPTKGVADFALDIDNFPVANIVDLLQSDVNATGLVTIHGSMTGTMSDPAFRGAFGVVYGTYNGATVPELHGRFGYADQELVAHVDALRNGGAPMAVLDGRFPIDLALSGVTGPRLLPRPMSMDLVADSLPLELIPQFTDLVQNVHGHVAGKIAMRGTLQRPALAGGFFVDQGTVQLTSTGATFKDVRGTVRMMNDTVYVDSITATAKGPVMLRGSLAVGNWREPAFNLYLVARGAELLHNQWGHLRMDAGLALTGPFDKAYVSGQVDVLDGVINAPEPTGRHVISAGDPAIFNVLDTAVVSDRTLFPAESPLLANLRVEVGLTVRHNTWVRNREANVEIYTDFPMMLRAEQQALALTGVVTTDRGEYEFMSKRFQIKRGSAMFIGSPDLNPTLQVTGEYQVQVAARGALNIRVLIGGTLRRPRLSLESDAQPPKTQSELLSLLAFGQSTTSLLAINGSSITGSAAVGDLFGVGAQLAVRRLAGVALGVLVNEVESEAGKALGTDVLDITPADVPTELTQAQGLGNFLTQTKVEAGKYINPRTFVTAQEQGGRPGAGIEHRTADGWQFRASFEPRLLLEEPTLSKQPFRPVRAYGGLIAREWRF